MFFFPFSKWKHEIHLANKNENGFMLAYHTTRNQAEKVKAEHEWQLLEKKPNRFSF